MKRNCTRVLDALIIAIAAVSCAFILTGNTYAQSNQLKKLVGEWELSTKSDPNDKRSVTFVISNAQLTGSYTTEAGAKLPITDISFANGRYSFRVSDAGLVFREIKFVGKNLEGVRFLTAQPKGKSVPRVVQMIRKPTD